MTTDIRWGIIGCGDVTEVKSGPAFNKVDNSSLVAVMRRDTEKAKDYAQRHNVPKWYDDAQALIDDPEINAVYIATPPSSHEAYTIATLRAGKNVYVEKPVTISAASCKRMIGAEEQYGVKLSVAHYRRALQLFLEIKKVIQQETLGRIKMIRLNMFKPPGAFAQAETGWRTDPAVSGGGLFFDLAPHQLDILQFIFGKAKRYKGIGAHQTTAYEAEDTVMGIIEYADDIVFTGNWCFTMPPSLEEDSCEIVGEEGQLKFAFFGDGYVLTNQNGIASRSFKRPEHVQQPMIERVVNYFLGRQENPCSVTEALHSIEIMESFIKDPSLY